jgi:hypothetical protein
VPYFCTTEETNRAIANVVVHESGHTIGCIDVYDVNFKHIMNGTLSPGAYLGKGFYDTHSPDSIKLMGVRLP